MTTDVWTRRRALGSGGALLGSVALGRRTRAAPSLKGSGSVVVFDGGGAWGDAQRQAYFEPFEKETGIHVVRSPRGPAGKFRASILAGAPAYDVADLSGGLLGTFTREKLLLPIDYAWFDPADRASFKPVDAGEFMVPSLFYSLVVAWSSSHFADKAPQVWTQLWDVKTFPGQRTLGQGSRGPGEGAFETALLADGVAPDKLYPLDFPRALRSLSRIRPDVLTFWDSGAQSIQLMIDGDVACGSAWNGRIHDMQAQGAKLGFSWDQGLLQWDALVVPKGARNVENAMKFLAFVSRPGPQARFAELISYGPTNARAYDLLKPERAALLPTAPQNQPKQIVQDYAFWSAEASPGVTNEQHATTLWEAWLTGG